MSKKFGFSKKQVVDLSASDDTGFFDVHGDTFTIREGLKIFKPRGMKTEDGFRWRFPNSAYPAVVEYLNGCASSKKIVLGEIELVDADETATASAGSDNDDEEPKGVVYTPLAKKNRAPADQSDIPTMFLAEIEKITALIKKGSGAQTSGSSKEDETAIKLLKEELAATEQSLSEETIRADTMVAKINKFINLLESKGEERFPASKFVENLRRIVS